MIFVLVWLISLRMIISRFIHVAANGIILFTVGLIIFRCTCLLDLLYPSSADGHLGCFHVLAVVDSAVMNIGVHVSY